MKYTDIAIIGGGLAGSTAAAMLGRAGISTILVDPHETYPFDFRIEKLSHSVTSLNSGGWSTNRVDLDWALRVTYADGKPVLEVQRSTQSPQPITWGGNHDAVIARLVAATLQDASRVLADLKL